MPGNLELLKADIRHELTQLKQLVKEFQSVTEKLKHEEIPTYDRGAIGYYLHNFYNGCESIFQTVASFFENDIEAKSWHRDLLRRMTLKINGYRPQLIDDQLYQLLDDFRGFRHKFRHSYGFELDWDKLRLVAKKLEKTATVFHIQTEDFIEKLEVLESG